MRPIKFRIWEITQQKMVYETPHVAVTIDGRPRFISEREALIEGKFWPEDLFVLEQFTGLKDRNVKDIYEGDILRIAEWNGTEVVFTQTGKVYWDPYACRFSIATDGGRGRISELNTSTNGLLSEQSRDEVVGNVHENPDLLS